MVSGQLFGPEDLESASDATLSEALLAVRAEVARRLVAAADPAALAEEAFSEGFGRDGLPSTPYVRSGLLVVPGALRESSRLSHRCVFGRADGVWAWEHPDRVLDVVREAPGPRRDMRSVTLLPAVPGLALDMLRSRTRNAVHQLQEVRSFEVSDTGELFALPARRMRADVTDR